MSEKIKLPEGGESIEGIEYVDVIFVRHGPRGTDGMLTEHAPEHIGESIKRVTDDLKKRFWGGDDKPDGFLVKPVGSSARPPGTSVESARSIQTAGVAAESVGEALDAKTLTLKPRPQLSYNSLKTPPPYNHEDVYNKALGRAMIKIGEFDAEHFEEIKDDFDKLKDELNEKLRTLDSNVQDDVSLKAQDATINHVFSIDTPEAQQFRDENAGMFVQLLQRYRKIPDRLTSREEDPERMEEERRIPPNTKNLIYVDGTHGGTMEYLLSEALVWRNAQGEKVVGFKDIGKAIGGGFDTSEAYTVRVPRDPQKKMEVVFHAPPGSIRPEGEFYIDPQRAQELADGYAKLNEHFRNLEDLNKQGDQKAFDAYKKEHDVAFDWKDEGLKATI